MASDLFPHMPRVDYEVLDRRLRLNPDYQGRHVVVLGCLDVDGYPTADLEQPPVRKTFRVSNLTGQPVTLSASVPDGFRITKWLSGPALPGSADTFEVEMKTSQAGSLGGSMNLVDTNDSSVYAFTLSGKVNSPLPARIDQHGWMEPMW